MNKIENQICILDRDFSECKVFNDLLSVNNEITSTEYSML